MTQSATLRWLEAAADNPLLRHPSHLPEALDFREHGGLFQRVYETAPPGTELGFPLLLKAGRLHFPEELAAPACYGAFHEGGRYVGSFHVHPPSKAQPSAAFFDPGDLARALRSDNPGFVDLLLTRDRLLALVRSNPYLYISAHHVNRNPMLLQEPHAEMVHRRGSHHPTDPGYDEHYRLAGLYYFRRYGLALYEGSPKEALKRTVTPESRW